MFTEDDARHLAKVRSQTEISLLETVGPPQDVALLDAPALINVGDSMIWQGQLAYMERLHYRVRYISDMQSFSAARLRKSLPNGGTILLRGGGNFGDIWVGHQEFRENVAKALPDYKIVQLTQSVFFGDPARAAQANKILSAHPSFRVLIRDEKSLVRAAASVPDVDVSMSFDMALGWDPKPAVRVEPTRAVVIARDDREAASGLLQAANGWKPPFDMRVTDWVSHSEHPDSWHRARKMLKTNSRALSLSRRFPLTPTLPQMTVESLLKHINDWNTDWAVDLFSGAKAMVVDRLHAHVLASLLGIPHVVLDNDHGKISTVFQAYTGQFSTAHYTTSTDEAYEILTRLMRE